MVNTFFCQSVAKVLILSGSNVSSDIEIAKCLKSIFGLNVQDRVGTYGKCILRWEMI